jgi:hypothetical protein
VKRSDLAILVTLTAAVTAILLAGTRAAPPPRMPATPVTAQDGRLALSCAHAVVGPDLIRGVIVVSNIGHDPLSLCLRWTDWGAGQWRISLGSATYGLERELVVSTALPPLLAELRPGERRAVRFHVVRTAEVQVAVPPPGGGWEFAGPRIRLPAAASDRSWLPRPFGGDMPMALRLLGHRLGTAADSDIAPSVPAAEIIREFSDDRAKPRLWSGSLQVASQQLDAPGALDRLCVDADGRPLAGDL